MKATDASKLEAEYMKLLNGLRENEENDEEDDFLANPGMAVLFLFRRIMFSDHGEGHL